nr:uncharacterized protein LOC120962104 isoform X1 [Aegilops tauschii subsp. strangulata]
MGRQTSSSKTEAGGEQHRKEEKHHKHMEQLAQLGAVAAGATRCTKSIRQRRTWRMPGRTGSRRRSQPRSPWVAPVSPSMSTTRRKTPRRTATTTDRARRWSYAIYT